MLRLFLIIISINLSLQFCIIDNRTPENAWEQTLHKDLLDNPDIHRMPCDGRDSVEAQVRLALKWFNYDSGEGIFVIYSWLFLIWEHPKITWNPADYGGLNETIMPMHHMWYPQLRIVNGLDLIDFIFYYQVPCTVSSTGSIFCATRIVDRVNCASDLTKWPYDTQTCSVKLGVPDMKNQTVRLRNSGRVITMIGADYGAEFDIIDYEQEQDQQAEAQITMKFFIERHAASLSAMVIYPCIALSIISIVSFTLDVRRMIRFGLVCFNLANHFCSFMELQEHIPGHSRYPPSILFYYRASMLTNMFLFLLTYILGVVCKRQKAPPIWICTINDIVFKGFGKFIVWPKWDSEVGTNEYSVQWTNFANIINSVFFVIIVIVYVCLYIVFMPQPLPLNY